MFVDTFKLKWMRPRPYLRDSIIAEKQCVDNHPASAYPSGHAAITRTFSLLAADLLPHYTRQFVDRANEVAYGRVIGGAHHVGYIEALTKSYH